MSGYEGFSQRNVSLIDDSATTNGDFPDYRRVTDRLATYKNWPVSMVGADACLHSLESEKSDFRVALAIDAAM